MVNTTTPRIRRIFLTALVALAFLSFIPATEGGHSTQTKTCTIDRGFTALQSATCGPGTITCPASHGICPFQITATIEGDGLVAATVFQNAAACGPSFGACTATHNYNVSPGLSSNPTCQMSATTTATNVRLVCTLSG